MSYVNQRILDLFKHQKILKSSDLSTKLKISRQAIHRHLKNLVLSQKILKQGSGNKNTFYILNTSSVRKSLRDRMSKWSQTIPVLNLEEDELYAKVEAQPALLDHLTSNNKKTLKYAFTEMVNNAIDHSQSKKITVAVENDGSMVRFSVKDTGVGIYQNIARKKGLKDEMEGLQELLKGKQTTLPERHSGEGIFFTSKIADLFIIESHRKKLRVDNKLSDIFIETIPFKKGTFVTFEIKTSSRKKLEDLFKEYTNENFEFDKTKIFIKLHQEDKEYVSRSQAKRVLHSLGSFSEIKLDFKGVKSIGQGFADEIFRVYQKRHPEKKIEALNAHEDVLFMIKRAQSHSG